MPTEGPGWRSMTARRKAGWLDGMVDRGSASYQLPFHFWQEENTSCMQTRHQNEYRPPGLIIRDQGRSPARESLLDSCLDCAQRGDVTGDADGFRMEAGEGRANSGRVIGDDAPRKCSRGVGRVSGSFYLSLGLASTPDSNRGPSQIHKFDLSYRAPPSLDRHRTSPTKAGHVTGFWRLQADTGRLLFG